MSLAWMSIGALLLAIALSCFTTINVGIVALTMALIVGVFFGDMTVGSVLEGFPTDLFVTLVGVTLLFSIAETNGTLARVTARAVQLCRGQPGALPIMFFLIGFLIATSGAGATPAAALLAPPAMAVAGRANIPPLLMAIMAGNGALAGTLSPFAPTGIIAHGVMERIGLGGVEWHTFAFNAVAHAIVGFGGFFLFGGWKLFDSRGAVSLGGTIQEPASTSPPLIQAEPPDIEPMKAENWLTLAGVLVFMLGVALLGLNVGMIALIVATVLILLRTTDESTAIKRMPWSVILMVTGVTVLIAILQRTEGMALITGAIASISSPATIAPIVGFTSGLVSVYSSTSGVVLPAFLPMAPELARELSGVEALNIAWSMNVGASLVDLSSLSTVGALFMASAAPGSDVRKLFNQLLAWGFSMAVVGAVLCGILFG